MKRRILVTDQVASASSVFVVLCLVIMSFYVVDYVTGVREDEILMSDFDKMYDGAFLGADGVGDLPSNWSDWNESVREDYFDEIHGCDKSYEINLVPWLDGKDLNFIGFGYWWDPVHGGDGYSIHANDYADLMRNIDYESDVDIGIGFGDLIDSFIGLVTLNFGFLEYFGYFAWVVKTPIWLGLIYVGLKALPFTG